MNNVFASYATGSVVRIDLTKRMVAALLRAAEGKALDTSHYGVDGLVKRGLAATIELEKKIYAKEVRLTEAGSKVADLCRLAGLWAR